MATPTEILAAGGLVNADLIVQAASATGVPLLLSSLPDTRHAHPPRRHPQGGPPMPHPPRGRRARHPRRSLPLDRRAVGGLSPIETRERSTPGGPAPKCKAPPATRTGGTTTKERTS